MKLYIGAAGVITKDSKVLLLKRASSLEKYPDHWGFVGGRIDNETEPLRETAKREVKEETSIDFEPTESFIFTETFTGDTHNIGHCFLGTWKGEPKINEEHSDLGWFTYEEAVKLPLAFQAREIIEMLRKRQII